MMKRETPNQYAHMHMTFFLTKVIRHCKTLIFCGYFILAILAVIWKERENISPQILYAELNQGSYKNGESDEYLKYFLYYPLTIHCGIPLESPR